MLDQVSVEKQYEQTAGDDLRVLVVGAGIAGVTVAQLLRRQHRHPVLIERAARGAGGGYMLALMPMVDAVLDRLGVCDAYRRASTPVPRYGLRNRHGHRARIDPIGELLDRYGDYRGIDRASLIEVLSSPDCPVAHETTIRATRNDADPSIPIMVAFDDHRSTGRRNSQSPVPPREYAFDVVILADGMGSTGRTLVAGDRPSQRTETGWSGWVVWIESDADADLGEELWGTGFFLGSYPVLDRIGVFLGGPDRELDRGPRVFVDSVLRRLKEISPRTGRALDAVQEADDPYRWPMSDVRSAVWTRNRMALLGDAAAGFMPTAGIGAGMAIESAGVLAAALDHATPSSVATALGDYERVQRPRVEGAQKTSRQLASMMFSSSRLVAVGRDLASRFVDVGTALKPIQRLLQTPPPDLSERGSVLAQPSSDNSDHSGGPSRSSGSLR